MSAVFRTSLCLLRLAICCLVPASVFAQPGVIPNFCAAPTKTAIASGTWATPGTWSPAGVPGAGDVVVIPAGITVTYGTMSVMVLDALCVEPKGLLTFSPALSTLLTVEDLHVRHGGELRIGAAAAPIPVPFIAEIVLGCFNTCLDTGTVASPGTDPEQFGLGLLVEGTLTIHGAVITPFTRLAAEVAAGATALTLGTLPTNWRAGDEVVLPESRPRRLGGNPRSAFEQFQSTGTFTPFDDRRILALPVTTTTAALMSAVTHPHPGGRNAAGVVEYYPHVANLSRTVVLRSATPSGTRGHVFLTHHATIDIRYASFKDLGRTTILPLHCTLYSFGAVQQQHDCTAGTGPLTRIGNHQKGRYAVHFHHLWGPPNPSNTGYQGVFLGNAVVDSTKWPISIHFSSYLQIQANVLAYGQGPALFFEEFNEHFNLIEGNLFTGMQSTMNPRCCTEAGNGGLEAAGIWGRGGQNNYIRNNVAAGFWNTFQQILTEVGYKFFIPAVGAQTRIPRFRGANLTVPAEYTLREIQRMPLLEFTGNEAYGMASAMTIWHIGSNGYAIMAGQSVSTVQDLVAWHVYEGAFFGYPIYNFVFDGLRMRGDPVQLSSYGYSTGDYMNHTVTIRNSDIQNVGTGVAQTWGMDGPLVIDNVVTKASIAGIEINGFYTPGTTATPVTARTTTIRNHTHTPLPGFPNRALWMRFDQTNACCAGHFHGDTLSYTTTLENYKGSGNTYRAYFPIQATQAYAGGLAPCTNTTTRPEIDGITCLAGSVLTAPPPTALTRVIIR